MYNLFHKILLGALKGNSTYYLIFFFSLLKNHAKKNAIQQSNQYKMYKPTKKLDCKFVVQLAHICSCLEDLSVLHTKAGQFHLHPTILIQNRTEQQSRVRNDRNNTLYATALHKIRGCNKIKHTAPFLQSILGTVTDPSWQ